MQVVEPVRAHGHSLRRGRRGDATKLADAAADRRVGLQDHGATLFQQFLVPPAPGLDLPGGNGNRRQLRQPRVVVDVVRAERLLDPVRVVRLVATHELQRRRQVLPGVVRIEHQQHVVADRLTRGADARLFAGQVVTPDLDLHGLESPRDIAGDFLGQLLRCLAFEVIAAARVRRHAFAGDAAEIAGQRQSRGPGVAVPQRDVERRQRAHHRAGAAVQQRVAIHLLPQSLDAQRAFTLQLAREEFTHRERHQRAAVAPPVAEADAHLVVGRPHPNHGVVARGHLPRREGGDLVQRNADRPRLDCNDLGSIFHWL